MIVTGTDKRKEQKMKKPIILEKVLIDERGVANIYIQATSEVENNNKIVMVDIQYEDDCKDFYLTCFINRFGFLVDENKKISSDIEKANEILLDFNITKRDLRRLYCKS
jgi:hypothetical protein